MEREKAGHLADQAQAPENKTEGDIESTIKEIAQSVLKLPDETIGSTTDLRDLPGVESIKLLRVVANVEKKFGIRIEDPVVFRVSSIADLAREVSKLVESR